MGTTNMEALENPDVPHIHYCSEHEEWWKCTSRACDAPILQICQSCIRKWIKESAFIREGEMIRETVVFSDDSDLEDFSVEVTGTGFTSIRVTGLTFVCGKNIEESIQALGRIAGVIKAAEKRLQALEMFSERKDV